MPLPPHAQDWMNRAEIDYIGPFIKAWAAFNAWYRHASGARKDIDGLRYVKQNPNPVRNAIMPQLRAAQRDGNNDFIADPEPAQKFKLLIRDLHVCLDNFHIEVMRDEVVERISFRSVCLGRGGNLPRSTSYRRVTYTINKTNGNWVSLATRANGTQIIRIEQPEYNLDNLIGHNHFADLLSNEQREQLRSLYQQCNPRPMIDLLGATGETIVAGDIHFRCTDQQLFDAVIELIYALRNTLLHGELQPHEQAFAAYEPAYQIVMKFLSCVR